MLTIDDSETRVLVVDDQLVNVTLLTRLLARAGVGHIEGVTDSRTVIERVLAFKPDVVLLDLQMPAPDGYQLLGEIGEIGDTYLPVIILTADVDQGARERALVGGAADFLTKPFDATETLLRIRNLVRTRRLHQQQQRHVADLARELAEHTSLERAAADRIDHIRALVTRSAESLTMVYQPIVDLETGAIDGAEALARFSLEPIRAPNEWFADAAEVGLGTDLEVTAVRGALAEADQLPTGAFLTINVSQNTLTSVEFASLLPTAMPRPVVIELTEHEPITDYGPVNDAMDRLRGQGVRLAVDDAGSGFAGLHHILRLRPDFIKLDRQLVTGIDVDPARRSLARALVTFSAETNARIVAEGIETPAELRTLRELGVTYGQGYHLARPGAMPLVELDIGQLLLDSD